MPRRSAEKERYWRGVLRRQRSSGLTIDEFCRGEELSKSSFYRWQRVIARRDLQTTRSTAKASRKRSPAARLAGNPGGKAPFFIPVQLNAAASSMIEVVHPLGHVLRVPAVFDQGCLRQVLEVLDQRGA